MVQVDLITGFLGSGKTTFMRHYARYMVQQGWNVCILENDFGAVNVDVMLLQDILGDHCDMESISGGCDCDTHQRRMRTKLISLAMQGFDRVIIEPSGIFDVDEFFDECRSENVFDWGGKWSTKIKAPAVPRRVFLFWCFVSCRGVEQGGGTAVPARWPMRNADAVRSSSSVESLSLYQWFAGA